VPLVLVVLAVLAGSGAARLAQALETGNPDDVAWAARQVGTEAVAAALVDGDRVARRAGAIAAPAVDDGWSLLDELAAAAADWERTRAVDAARAALAIARRFDGDAAATGDVPDDVLADLARAWSELARRADRWPDVRVAALEIAARLARARLATTDDDPGLGFDLEAMLADADPLLRRTAAELVPMPTDSALRPALARVVSADADPSVVVAAAQAVCADLAAGDDAGPILSALGGSGIERLRVVLGADAARSLPAGAIVDAARCLAADGAPASRAALRSLAARAPRAARSALARVAP
jgi:hypothetical protein